jgi:hypothetical protein
MNNFFIKIYIIKCFGNLNIHFKKVYQDILYKIYKIKQIYQKELIIKYYNNSKNIYYLIINILDYLLLLNQH